jgi:hypothetical protein
MSEGRCAVPREGVQGGGGKAGGTWKYPKKLKATVTTEQRRRYWFVWRVLTAQFANACSFVCDPHTPAW